MKINLRLTGSKSPVKTKPKKNPKKKSKLPWILAFHGELFPW